MEKLNKVIAGLEACQGTGNDCERCPYISEGEKCSDVREADALAVLRKYRAAQSSGDLISRSALLESIEGTDWYTIKYNGDVSQGAPCEEVAWYKATDMYAAVAAAPAVEVEPVVHAHWEDEYGGKFANPRYRCSACKGKSFHTVEQDNLLSWHEVQALTDRCPHCGAHMDEEAKK